MDARRLRIEELFARALEVEPAARAALLAEACGGDDELRREVESLVAHAPAGPRAFASVVRATAATLGAELRRPDLGARVGPYRLVSLLGEGGMGAVYVAERADDAFHKRVAIKVLRHGLASPEAIARFRDERQILARLEHPAIVRMLDGGAAEHGAPYLVMELVQGTPLAAYAASRRLRERIALMIAVCEAVHHAHQHLVVHRDLKPANILVDDGGRPKLLDFGIAKLLDPGEALAREARTVTGMALLTVEYASPEQARGDTVTVATDVYALGAVLYELLVGHPPQRAEADLVATLRRICDVDPPRPSQAAPPAARRALVGELDNIVMKALQKSPAARYPSVAALADDLRSFLDGRPISARDATWSYRAGKFVRRHRGALALATTIGIALAAAAVVALVAAGRARRQTRVAERRTRALLVEQGRQEVAAGRDSRALPYLAEVLAEGEDTPAIRLLVAEARRTVDRQVGATVVAPHGLDDVAWSSDGATLVLGGERGYLRLFDPDLHELRRLDRGASRSYGFARSPDGRALVASRWPSDPRAGGDDPGELRLLYADGRERSFPFACPHPAISDEHVACRRDEDGSFVVHDLDRGAEILARTVTGGVLIALAPDDRAVFVDRADGTIERWVLATGARELELRGHRGVIKKMIAAADGRLITCASDGTARVWDGERGRLLSTIDGLDGGCSDVELDPAGTHLAVAPYDGPTRLWALDGASGSVELKATGNASVRLVRYDHAGQRVVTVGYDNTFRVFDAVTGTEQILIESLPTAPDTPYASGGPVQALFSPASDRLVTVSGTEARMWRVDSAPLLAELRTPFLAYGGRMSPDEREIAVAGERIAIAEVSDGRVRTTFDVGAAADDVDWSPDGARLVVAGHDGLAAVVDRDGRRLGALVGHRRTVNSASYSPDGATIATACDDGQVRLWDAATFALVRSLPHPDRVLAAAWSRDGRHLVTAGWDRTVRVWDPSTGLLLRAIGGGATQYLNASLSPDGATVATGGHDGEVSLWRVDTGERLRSLDGHTGPVTSVQWSPDGALLLTAADDSTLRVWDPSTGKLLATRRHPRTVMQASWTHDGERVVSIAHEGTVRIWSFARDRHPVAEIRALAASRSPWRLEDDRLVRTR